MHEARARVLDPRSPWPFPSAGNQNVGMNYDDADEAADDQAEATLRLFPPLLLMSAATSCWHCKAGFTAKQRFHFRESSQGPMLR